MAQKPLAFENSSEVENLVCANTEFAVKLLKQLALEKAGNIFISPASISIAMAMTYLGARGQSVSELGKVLGFNQVAEDSLHQSFSQLRQAFHLSDNKCQLKTANRLYGDKSYTFLEEFLSNTKSHYEAEMAAVDFKTNNEGARQEINKWVEEQTERKIVDLLQAGSLNSLTRLVLVNAIYFSGDWAKKFDPLKTQSTEFFISKDEKVQVEMMYKKDKFRYGVYRKEDDILMQVVELPYVDEKLSMFVFLPSEGYGMDGLITNIHPEYFTDTETFFDMHSSDVHVYLPRFKMEEILSLKDTFCSLGVKHIFSDTADLSGIDGARQLQVSEVFHKAFVDVNEEGTEAAAATTLDIVWLCKLTTVTFHANRPFVFMIRDNLSQSVLFLGKFAKP